MSRTWRRQRPPGQPPVAPTHVRRLRLFWLMVLSFTLAITLAVCGMISFVGLTFAGTLPMGSFREGLRDTAQSYAVLLGDYYQANGESWAGVDQRLNRPPFTGTNNLYAFTLLDSQENVIIGSVAAPTRAFGHDGTRPRPGPPSERAAIMVRGRTIGELVVRPDFEFQPIVRDRQNPSILSGVWRSFLFAGLTIGGLLLVLAVIFARRLTRPLQMLTAASEALAAGKLDTHVPSASVRELDELASAFNRMADALASADTQRRQMTADIAHELRTPLSIIRGRLEGVQDGVYEANPDQIAGLLSETALLERLVDDLRLLALAEAGQLPLYREPTDVRDLLESVARSFADQAAQQQVTLRIEVPDALPELEVDPQRIAQVLANLVSNALRYTPSGGCITLSAAMQPQAVQIEVRDTGSGIATQDLPKVFDRFWRADRSRTRGSGGAGLGLAIVRQIVEAHGGSISVSSDQGASFRMLLPVQPPNPQA